MSSAPFLPALDTPRVQIRRNPMASLRVHPNGWETGWWVGILALSLLGWLAQSLISFDPSTDHDIPHYWTGALVELLHLAIGLGLGFGFRMASPATRRALAGWSLPVSVLLLGWVALHGQTINGAHRWIQLGIFSFQPLEFAKLSVIATGALAFAPGKIRTPAKQTEFLRRSLSLLMIAIVLVVLQPNISGTFILGCLAFGLAAAGGVPWKLLGIGALICAVLLGAYVLQDHERSQRVRSVGATNATNPDIKEEQYQSTQAGYAIAQGGWFGVGAGHSTVKHTLPASDCDFIFAILVEEYGVLGGMAIIGMLAAAVWVVLHLSIACQDRFLQFLGYGIALHWGVQNLLNLQVNLGGVTTGVPLLFFSKGGSAAMMLGIEVAVVALIAATVDRQRSQSLQMRVVD